MSLKAGAKRSAARASFCDFLVEIKQQAGKWETWFTFSTFPRLAGAVGMWESRERFPRAMGSEGNLVLVFLVFHSPSFPQLPGFFMRCACDAGERTACIWLPASRLRLGYPISAWPIRRAGPR